MNDPKQKWDKFIDETNTLAATIRELNDAVKATTVVFCWFVILKEYEEYHSQPDKWKVVAEWN